MEREKTRENGTSEKCEGIDPDLPPVKQEPPGPEEDGEEKKDDVSETTPAEEIGGVGTPVVSAGGRANPILNLPYLLPLY